MIILSSYWKLWCYKTNAKKDTWPLPELIRFGKNGKFDTFENWSWFPPQIRLYQSPLPFPSKFTKIISFQIAFSLRFQRFTRLEFLGKIIQNSREVMGYKNDSPCADGLNFRLLSLEGTSIWNVFLFALLICLLGTARQVQKSYRPHADHLTKVGSLRIKCISDNSITLGH